MSRLPFPLVLVVALGALVTMALLVTMLEQPMDALLPMVESTTESEDAVAGHQWLQRAWWMFPVISLGLVIIGTIVAASTRGGVS